MFPLVRISESVQFTYQPPTQALGARRILVKPNLGYPAPHPATVSMPILAAVLQGLRRGSPQAEILIVEGVCSSQSLAAIAQKQGILKLLDDRMQLLDADQLPLAQYPNRLPNPVRFASMQAPTLLQEVDCRISVSALKRTMLKGEALISASLKNLYGLFPRSVYKARSPNSRGQLHRPSVPLILQDVYGCIGHLFDGAVVDGTCRYISPDWKPDRARAAAPFGKIFWGDSLLAVDRAACQTAGETIPNYITMLEKRLKAAPLASSLPG